MVRKTLIVAGLALAFAGSHSAARAQGALPLDGKLPDFPALTKKSVQLSLPLIQSSATTFGSKQMCVSCHHDSLPNMAVAIARERGFKVNEAAAKATSERVYKFLVPVKELARAALTQPAAEKKLDTITVDPAPSVGYILAGLSAEKWKSDELMESLALYLAKKQQANGSWEVSTARPPLEASEFMATALAIQGMKAYAPKSHAEEIEKRIEKAKAWLVSTPPKTTEDRTFRLLGLQWANADKADINKAVADILAEQNDDGGWGQNSNASSDAYATGQTLVALNKAGGIPTTASAYRRGAFFLLATQRTDGSWFVAKRATAVQPPFDSGFPHGNAQFISICGTSWATMALALSVDSPTTTASTILHF